MTKPHHLPQGDGHAMTRLIWSPCRGVHDVAAAGLRCDVDALSGVCPRRSSTQPPLQLLASGCPSDDPHFHHGGDGEARLSCCGPAGPVQGNAAAPVTCAGSRGGTSDPGTLAKRWATSCSPARPDTAPGSMVVARVAWRSRSRRQTAWRQRRPSPSFSGIRSLGGG
jgi:hypothetical protein